MAQAERAEIGIKNKLETYRAVFEISRKRKPSYFKIWSYSKQRHSGLKARVFIICVIRYEKNSGLRASHMASCF